MHLVVRRSLTALLLAGVTLTVLSCGDSAGPNGANTVSVKNNAFDPATLNVAVGQSVTWQWTAGSNPHNVTWVDQSGTGNSATQSSGTYSRTFSAAGTFNYFCSLHGTATSGMRGSVVVQ